MDEDLAEGHAVTIAVHNFVKYCDFRKGDFPPGTILDTNVKPSCLLVEWETELVSIGGLCEDCGKTCAADAYFEVEEGKGWVDLGRKE